MWQSQYITRHGPQGIAYAQAVEDNTEQKGKDASAALPHVSTAQVCLPAGMHKLESPTRLLLEQAIAILRDEGSVPSSRWTDMFASIQLGADDPIMNLLQPENQPDNMVGVDTEAYASTGGYELLPSDEPPQRTKLLHRLQYHVNSMVQQLTQPVAIYSTSSTKWYQLDSIEAFQSADVAQCLPFLFHMSPSSSAAWDNIIRALSCNLASDQMRARALWCLR